MTVSFLLTFSPGDARSPDFQSEEIAQWSLGAFKISENGCALYRDNTVVGGGVGAFMDRSVCLK